MSRSVRRDHHTPDLHIIFVYDGYVIFFTNHSGPLRADSVRDCPGIGASLFIVSAFMAQNVACRKVTD